MADFAHDFGWQERFIPQITPILGRYLIAAAPAQEDMKRNSDFMVLEIGTTVRVACRVRRWEELAKCPWYAEEFTIRATRPSGLPTELWKVIEGWGSHIFYAFSNQQEDDLAGWVLGDLNVFRSWHSRELAWFGKNDRRWEEHANKDGSSKFRAYKLKDLPPHFVVARQPCPEINAAPAIDWSDVADRQPSRAVWAE